MARYSESFKISIMQKMMPPENQKVSTIAQEAAQKQKELKEQEKAYRKPGT
ncbi:hypothetical protein [Tindallia californiensis]|uniref:Uncharacterized protein n=1 Tax=Tindallia californiensis TaxID=159292 RepID=A0A1H3JZP2_9FIRM|nr:hypothetical protein [Tindallia californiensis]SDY44995.1 hypothetical protein SAMN05192546_102159 [Tindallia californiensis]